MRKIASLLGVLMLCSVLAFAQQRTVTGRVTDEAGNPVPYATITETGTNNATTADANGNYTIRIQSNGRLVVTSTGFQDFAVTPSGTSADVKMTRSAGQLTEVVVTALGQSRSRDKVGYSATTFKSEDVTRTAPVSPLDALQGKVAGADISTVGGQPGSSSKVILRGYISLSGSNQALIVVDGVPFNNSRLGSGTRGASNVLNAQGGVDFGNGLNDLNPSDIDNVTILKGAAATSLYGSRALNGVIMITTKKGRNGGMRVELNSSAMFSTVGKLPDFQNVWGQGWNGQHYKEENGSWGPKMDGADRLWGSIVDNSRLIKPFSPVEDNVRHFYDMGREFNNSVSLRGGNENANYYFSYGNVSSNGVLPTDADSYTRNTFGLRGQLKASDKFTISTSFNYMNKHNKTVSTDDDEAGSSTFENILQIPRDFYITDFKDYNNKFFNVDNYFTPYAANPYFTINENSDRLVADRFFGNVDLSYKLNNSFNVQWRTGADFTNARGRAWQAIENPKSGSWRGPNPTNAEGASYTAKVGGLTESSDYVGEINSDLLLNINRDVSQDVNISGFVGGNFNQRESRTFSSRITQLTIPGFYNLSNSSNPPTSNEAIVRRRLMGAYAQATIGYKDYLFVGLNARNDWSSTLPKGHRTFFYPGANLSLVLSKLTDLSHSKIDYLKVRAAYGQSGNDASPYLIESTLTPGDVLLGFGNIVFPINNVSAFEIGNRIGNQSLKPEITTEIEVGAEARFLKNRLGFDFSWYRKRSNNQILSVPIPASTGYTSIVTNFGTIQNMGVELSVNITPVRLKDFSWDMNYTFTRNRNKVIDLPAGLDKVDFSTYYDVKMVARAGQPMGLIEAPSIQQTADGRYIATSTGFYATTNEDVLKGNVQRDFMMGLNNSFTYKGFRLGFTLDYRKGGMMVSRTADLTYFVGNAYNTQYNDRRPFIIPNSVVQTGVDGNGKPIYEENTTPIDVTNYNSYWYHTTNKGFAYNNMLLPKSFLKLRDVTLSYTLPKRWSGKIKAQTATVSLIGRNFLLWTPKENMFVDPEVSDIGNDFLSEFGEVAAAPATKSYGVSLKLTF